MTDGCNMEVEESTPKDESKMKELKNEILEAVCEQQTAEQVKDEEEESDQEVETDDEEVEDKGMETTPEISEASVVKYSVKTTPYLQR